MSDLSGDNGSTIDTSTPYVPPVTAPESEELKYAPYDKILREGAGFTNPRGKAGLVKLKEVAESIKGRLAQGRPGLRNPLIVWETRNEEGDDILLLVGGSRRHSAIGMLIEANDAGELADKVPYIPFKGDLKAAMAEALADNLNREDLTTYEMSSAMADLSALGMEQKEIALRIGKSPSYVSIGLSTFNKTSKSVRAAWEKDEIPLESATILSKIPEDEQEAALTEQLTEREEGRAGAKAARKAGKKRVGKSERASVKEISEILILGDGYEKDESYVHGMMDMAKFAMGSISLNQFARPWKEFQRAKKDEAEVKAAKAEAEAAEKAEPVVKRKPGRPKKVVVAGAGASAEAAPKRGPGRPRKVVEVDADPVIKRGPGRPRKVVVDDDE